MIRPVLACAAIAASMLFGGLPASAQAPLIRQSGDWLLVCDNRRSCTITGVARPEVRRERPRVVFRFSRDNEGEALLLLQTWIIDEAGAPHPEHPSVAPFSLSRTPIHDVVAPLNVDPGLSDGAGGDGFTPEDSAYLANAIARARPNYVRSGMGVFAAMPIGDFARLLRRMNRAQPAVRRPRAEVPLVRQEGFLYEIFPSEEVSRPIDHLVFIRTCPGTRRQTRAYRLDHLAVEGTLLVLVRCGGSDQLFTWYPAGGAPPVPLRLPRRVNPRDRVMDASFEPGQGILTITDHPPGRADCGARHDWGWVAGEGMVLLTRRIMPDCRGVRPELWPVQFMQLDWTTR